MKKFLSLILSVLLVLAFACFSVGCKDKNKSSSKIESEKTFLNDIGGCSETYDGNVSTKQYTTQDNAVYDYVAQEIVSDSSKNLAIEQTNTTTLTSEEASLIVPSRFMENAVSVKKIEANYSVTNNASQTSTYSFKTFATSDASKKIVIYVIDYGEYFKYFTPMVTTGETVTKSYYDSIFNWKKYENCTINNTTYIDIKVDGYTLTTKTTSIIKYTEDKVYMEITTTVLGESVTIKFYIEKVEETLKSYIFYDDSWQEVDLRTLGNSLAQAGQTIEGGELTSIDQLAPFKDSYLDFSYFKKTDYGCELTEEHFIAYLNQAFKQSMQDNSSSIGMKNMNFKGSVKYYVSKGVLSGIRTQVNMSYAIEVEQQTSNVSMQITCSEKCLDYGTTTITRPADLTI